MKINMPINYGSVANATSLNLIAKKLFCELGKIMNERKSFTIAATLLDDLKIGDINQKYDCVSIPNMGGYMFPPQFALSSNNLFVGLVGIDEVVLGKKVFRNEIMWKRSEPIIQKELKKWENDVNKINKIHVSTQSEKEQMMKYLKIPEEKLVIIPLGVDHNFFKPSLDKEKTRKKMLGSFLIKDTPYFIHISEINWARKNIFRLLEAFKKAKSYGISQNLIIVGKNEQIVYDKAKEIPGVILLGFVSDEHLVSLIQGSDGLINPSLHEGFGLPILESMACGIPILTSNTSSPPEIVQEGGLLVDPLDTFDICKKIQSLAENKELCINLGQNALKRSKDFSWSLTAKKLLELIEKNCSVKSDDNYDDYDVSAYRTLTTIIQSHPSLNHILFQDLLEFNYERIINWCLEVGINDPTIQDFIIPFKEWLEDHS